MDSSIYARVVANSTSDVPNQFRDVTYTVEVITLYKGDGETYVDDGQITFLTKASSGLCGISLSVGDDADGEEPEYLLGLKSSEGDTTLRAELCGIYWEWSSDVDVSLLESCGSTPSPAQPTPSSTQVIKTKK